MKKTIFTVFLIIVIALLAACGSKDEKTVTEKETANIKELINNFSTGKISDQSASITSHELQVTKGDGSQEVYDLSKEDFFVSIAPYINETHP